MHDSASSGRKSAATTPALRFFDEVVVINLPSRPDRRRDTARELGTLGPDISRVTWFDAVRGDDAHGFPSLGAYGCFQSHLRVLERAVADQRESVLIVEDDVRVQSAFHDCWPDVARALQSQPWDLVHLGFQPGEFGPFDGSTAVVPVVQEMRTAHCYAVHARVMPSLVAFLHELQTRPWKHPEGGRMHYDGALNVFCRTHPDVVRLRASTNLARQRASRSDIATLPWFDRVRIARPLVERCRAFRSAFRPR